MALFNYADTLEEVQEYLSNSNNYLKLLFTGDGHIVTHNIDFTPDFAPGQRGLVSGSSGKSTDFLRATNTWGAITVNDLPTTDLISSDPTHIPTSKAVFDYVGGFVKAAETLRFKGVITYKRNSYYVGNNVGFPNICEIGDTYRVGTIDAGTAYFAEVLCEPGDMLICIKNNSDAELSTNSSEYWTVVQTNINGTKKTTINGFDHYFYSTSSEPLSLFAPTTSGDSGDILISTGEEPKWGKITFVEGNLVISENDNIRYSIPVEASSLYNSLNAGVGLIFGTNDTSFNGGKSSTLNLLKATEDIIGGIKIDSDHGYNGGATISVDDGTIYLTADNIKNALGYDIMGAYQEVNYQNKGLVPSLNDMGGVLSGEYNVLAFKDEDTLDWYKLPETAFFDTWRDIQVGNESIENKTLCINPSEDIRITKIDNEDSVDVSFTINWFNLSANNGEGAYEYL